MQTLKTIGGISRATKDNSAHRLNSLYHPFWKCHREHFDNVKFKKCHACFSRHAFERVYRLSNENISGPF